MNRIIRVYTDYGDGDSVHGYYPDTDEGVQKVCDLVLKLALAINGEYTNYPVCVHKYIVGEELPFNYLPEQLLITYCHYHNGKATRLILNGPLASRIKVPEPFASLPRK